MSERELIQRARDLEGRVSGPVPVTHWLTILHPDRALASALLQLGSPSRHVRRAALANLRVIVPAIEEAAQCRRRA